MSARLTTPNDDPSVTHVLSPDVAETTLMDLWDKAASCLVQLSRLTFPQIGALVEVEDEAGKPDSSSYAIADRPVTHNMTDMVRLANVPRADLPPEGTTTARPISGTSRWQRCTSRSPSSSTTTWSSRPTTARTNSSRARSSGGWPSRVGFLALGLPRTTGPLSPLKPLTEPLYARSPLGPVNFGCRVTTFAQATCC